MQQVLKEENILLEEELKDVRDKLVTVRAELQIQSTWVKVLAVICLVLVVMLWRQPSALVSVTVPPGAASDVYQAPEKVLQVDMAANELLQREIENLKKKIEASAQNPDAFGMNEIRTDDETVNSIFSFSSMLYATGIAVVFVAYALLAFKSLKNKAAFSMTSGLFGGGFLMFGNILLGRGKDLFMGGYLQVIASALFCVICFRLVVNVSENSDPGSAAKASAGAGANTRFSSVKKMNMGKAVESYLFYAFLSRELLFVSPAVKFMPEDVQVKARTEMKTESEKLQAESNYTQVRRFMLLNEDFSLCCSLIRYVWFLLLTERSLVLIRM